jgi:hypothetical protein
LRQGTFIDQAEYLLGQSIHALTNAQLREIFPDAQQILFRTLCAVVDHLY